MNDPKTTTTDPQSGHSSNNFHHKEWEIDNLPNRLTVFRILLVPLVIGSLYLNLIDFGQSPDLKSWFGWISAWIFGVASITDFFDGYLARKRNLITVFGSFLDPVADKFLVVSSLMMLGALNRIPILIVIILVLREFYITSLRLLAHERGLSVPVGTMGKWKTGLQMVGIPFLMAYERPWGIPFPELGLFFIYGASVFSLYSALEYTLSLLKKLNELRLERKAEKKLARKLRRELRREARQQTGQSGEHHHDLDHDDHDKEDHDHDEVDPKEE